MDKHQRAGTVPVQRLTPAKAARVAAAPVHRYTVVLPPGVVSRATLADVQDAETSAPNDSGAPTTPSEKGPDGGGDGPESPAELIGTEEKEAKEAGREAEKMPGEEEHQGAVMNWFDELGS